MVFPEKKKKKVNFQMAWWKSSDPHETLKQNGFWRTLLPVWLKIAHNLTTSCFFCKVRTILMWLKHWIVPVRKPLGEESSPKRDRSRLSREKNKRFFFVFFFWYGRVCVSVSSGEKSEGMRRACEKSNFLPYKIREHFVCGQDIFLFVFFI